MSILRADSAGPSAGGTTYSLTDGVAKAWASWDATSGTPTINGSSNASSMTDISVGDANLNFTNAMADGFFAVPTGSTANSITSIDNRTTLKFRARTITSFTVYADLADVLTTVHGDLA